MPQKLFVANWKMNKSFAQAVTFCTNHKDSFSRLASNHEIVLCPSYPALFTLGQLFTDTQIILGAQECSPHKEGAYTGQVSAQSLKEVGCSYCIIGHSEQRVLGKQTNQDIAEKCSRLLDQKIIPIICIGETQQEYDQNKTYDILEKQIEPLYEKLSTHNTFVIAYEPIWAIGTGEIPEISYLADIFAWINKNLGSKLDKEQWQLIYGGSVNETNAAQLLQIEGINGFLLGGASLDFQKFEKIVSLG